MLAYYGYTISPNQLETGEGFLICRNVPIARTGDQEYLGQEIGLAGPDAARVITVHRAPEEVFSVAAMASFEGKPVTNDHPPCLIGPDDVSVYEKGHAQAIRKGEGEWADYVLADIHIHDRALIDAVKNGKREISCGYECEYVQDGDGTYSQKNIRGNHIAVVDRGRAGKLAAILDSGTAKGTINKKQARRPERKAMKKQGFLFKIFGQAVKDKSPEEIEQLAMDAAAVLDEEAVKPAKEEKPEAGEKDLGEKEAEDESAIDRIADKVMAKLAAKEAGKEKGETKDSLDAAIEALTGGQDSQTGGDTAGEGASRVIPAEEEDRGCGMDKALAAGILKAMRPSVAAIGDEAQRKAVADALISLVTAKDEKNDIAAILQASQKNAQRIADSKPAGMDNDAIQALYDAMNPHRRKESK